MRLPPALRLLLAAAVATAAAGTAAAGAGGSAAAAAAAGVPFDLESRGLLSRCSIDRKPQLTLAEFAAEYQGRRPVIFLANSTGDGAACAASVQLPALRRRLGPDMPVPVVDLSGMALQGFRSTTFGNLLEVRGQVWAQLLLRENKYGESAVLLSDIFSFDLMKSTAGIVFLTSANNGHIILTCAMVLSHYILFFLPRSPQFDFPISQMYRSRDSYHNPNAQAHLSAQVFSHDFAQTPGVLDHCGVPQLLAEIFQSKNGKRRSGYDEWASTTFILNTAVQPAEMGIGAPGTGLPWHWHGTVWANHLVSGRKR